MLRCANVSAMCCIAAARAEHEPWNWGDTNFCFVFQDDLSNLSEEKDYGDVTVTLHNEDILPEYTIRTMKVCRQYIKLFYPEVF